MSFDESVVFLEHLGCKKTHNPGSFGLHFGGVFIIPIENTGKFRIFGNDAIFTALGIKKLTEVIAFNTDSWPKYSGYATLS